MFYKDSHFPGSGDINYVSGKCELLYNWYLCDKLNHFFVCLINWLALNEWQWQLS